MTGKSTALTAGFIPTALLNLTGTLAPSQRERAETLAREQQQTVAAMVRRRAIDADDERLLLGMVGLS